MMLGIGWWPVAGMTDEEVSQEYACMLRTMLRVHTASGLCALFGYEEMTIRRDRRDLGLHVQKTVGGSKKRLVVPYAGGLYTFEQLAMKLKKPYNTIYGRFRPNAIRGAL